MIEYAKEICEVLGLPSIPKKKWDGNSSFNNGVAVVTLAQERKAYAMCSFDNEVDAEPRITRVFMQEPFYGVEDIFVVPAYMETDVENADLDEESKKAAERLAQEAEEMIQEEQKMELPENPFFFDEIHNIEEARAWLAAYNSRNHIKGKLPKNEETIKLRLLAIWTELQNK